MGQGRISITFLRHTATVTLQVHAYHRYMRIFYLSPAAHSDLNIYVPAWTLRTYAIWQSSCTVRKILIHLYAKTARNPGTPQGSWLSGRYRLTTTNNTLFGPKSWGKRRWSIGLFFFFFADFEEVLLLLAISVGLATLMLGLKMLLFVLN